MRGLSLQRRHKRSYRCKMVQRRWRISTAFAVLVEERGDCEGNIVEPWDHARCHHLIPGHRRDVRLPLQHRVYLWSLLPEDFYIFHRLIWALGVLVLDYRFRSLPASLLLDGKYTNVYSFRIILLRIIRTTLKVDKCRWIFVVPQVPIVFLLVRCALSRSLLQGRRENIFLLLENDLPPCLSYPQESKGISQHLQFLFNTFHFLKFDIHCYSKVLESWRNNWILTRIMRHRILIFYNFVYFHRNVT